MSDESNPAGGFADLFEAEPNAVPTTQRVNVGDKVSGAVVLIGEQSVFVELDGKQQAYFESIDVQAGVEVGQTLTGHVVAVDSATGQIRLSTRMGGGSQVDPEQLRAAFESGAPIEGKVVGVNKGGVSVDIGGVRAFCPISKLDRIFVSDSSKYLQQSLRFRITKLEGRDVVVSRRELLEEEVALERDAAIAEITRGAILKGKVSRVREFGAFVELGGGIEGMIPVSEMAHERVSSATDRLSTGDNVEVKVLEISKKDGKDRIRLSLKALASDPWDNLDTIAPLGTVVAGQVARVKDFGAFVRLAPGVEGLLHVSQLSASVTDANEVLSIGQRGLYVVESVDKKRRRVGLAPAPTGAAAGSKASGPAVVVGQVVDVTVEKIERFGVFVQIEGTTGRSGRGLLPTKELAVREGADLRKEFPVGTKVKAKLIGKDGGKLRFSIKELLADEERAVFDGYREKQAAKSMGTFADLLKNRGK